MLNNVVQFRLSVPKGYYGQKNFPNLIAQFSGPRRLKLIKNGNLIIINKPQKRNKKVLRAMLLPIRLLFTLSTWFTKPRDPEELELRWHSRDAEHDPTSHLICWHSCHLLIEPSDAAPRGTWWLCGDPETFKLFIASSTFTLSINPNKSRLLREVDHRSNSCTVALWLVL